MINEFLKLIPKRKPDSYKGDYGHVVVLAGSVGLTGAACLTAEAALRSGSGAVTLGVPRSLNTIFEVKLTEVMTWPLPETDAQALGLNSLTQIRKLLLRSDVVAIGPGLSNNEQTKLLVQKLISVVEKPIILDADGINAFEGKPELLKVCKEPLVITPHHGEMARLSGLDLNEILKDRKTIALDFAKNYNTIVVLKGNHTIVASPTGDCYINDTGNPGMATAGAGDVLTGMIASFVGQKMHIFEAAKLAVYLHGYAGDLALKDTGPASLIASDILNKLPQAIKTILK